MSSILISNELANSGFYFKSSSPASFIDPSFTSAPLIIPPSIDLNLGCFAHSSMCF